MICRFVCALHAQHKFVTHDPVITLREANNRTEVERFRYNNCDRSDSFVPFEAVSFLLYVSISLPTCCLWTDFRVLIPASICLNARLLRCVDLEIANGMYDVGVYIRVCCGCSQGDLHYHSIHRLLACIQDEEGLAELQLRPDQVQKGMQRTRRVSARSVARYCSVDGYWGWLKRVEGYEEMVEKSKRRKMLPNVLLLLLSILSVTSHLLP